MNFFCAMPITASLDICIPYTQMPILNGVKNRLLS